MYQAPAAGTEASARSTSSRFGHARKSALWCGSAIHARPYQTNNTTPETPPAIRMLFQSMRETSSSPSHGLPRAGIESARSHGEGPPAREASAGEPADERSSPESTV